jgi:hypothetical protein
MKKKILFLAAGALFFGINAKAQLQDEKNVTITMDLQPILQLNMQGPDQIDFTFDQISKYYSGITKYGVTTLKVSASVSFDLWAAGLSQGEVAADPNFLWDNPMQYAAASGGLNTLPLTALELHQFPVNPAIAPCALAAGPAVALSSDYDQPFQAVGALTGNNCIYTPSNATPYLPPGSTAVAVTSEKYIAGASSNTAGCQVQGGTYLQQAMVAGVPATAGYYFVMDYRLLPNLPANFPFHIPNNNTNKTANYMTNADLSVAATLDVLPAYIQPGVYTMYVKYILAQDQ